MCACSTCIRFKCVWCIYVHACSVWNTCCVYLERVFMWYVHVMCLDMLHFVMCCVVCVCVISRVVCVPTVYCCSACTCIMSILCTVCITCVICLSKGCVWYMFWTCTLKNGINFSLLSAHVPLCAKSLSIQKTYIKLPREYQGGTSLQETFFPLQRLHSTSFVP